MKYLKRYDTLVLTESSGRNRIDSICKNYGITNYTINSDGSIDVNGSVSFFNGLLTKLPLKFNNVSGDFNCSYNQLTSLRGCPKSVGGYFDCDYNELTSLEGCPKSVGGYFDCSNNQITSLEGCPEFVGRNFICSDNPVHNLWSLFHNKSKIELFNYYDIVRDEYTDQPKIVLDRLNSFLEEIGRPKVEEVGGYTII